jgi:hypothetical protein
MNKLVEKYQKLISKGRMTKTEINSMRKALGMCSSLTKEEKSVILSSFWNKVNACGGIKITAEHTEQGLNYLKSIAFTSKGLRRNTKDYPFGERELDILRGFKEFALVGLDEQYNGLGNVLGYSPVWQVRSKKTFFEYVQDGRWAPVRIVA